jgi:hypothetical protein
LGIGTSPSYLGTVRFCLLQVFLSFFYFINKVDSMLNHDSCMCSR